MIPAFYILEVPSIHLKIHTLKKQEAQATVGQIQSAQLGHHTSAILQIHEHLHHIMVILAFQTTVPYTPQVSLLLIHIQGLHKIIMDPIQKHLIPAFHILEVPSIHLQLHTLALATMGHIQSAQLVQRTSAIPQIHKHLHHIMVIPAFQTIILYTQQESLLLILIQGLHKIIMVPILKHLIRALHTLKVPSIHLKLHILKKQEAQATVRQIQSAQLGHHTSATPQIHKHLHHIMVILAFQTTVPYTLQESLLPILIQGLHKIIMDPILKHLITAIIL